MHRVVLVSLLFSLQSSMAFGQRPVIPNKAEEALQLQQFRFGITNQEDRSRLELTRRTFAAREKLQTNNAMLTRELAVLLIHSKRTEGGPPSDEILESYILRLQENAEERIPAVATSSQRAKLRAAAGIDIRRNITYFRSRIKEDEMGFLRDVSRLGGWDLFGDESLFAKVMRQQSLR